MKRFLLVFAALPLAVLTGCIGASSEAPQSAASDLDAGALGVDVIAERVPIASFDGTVLDSFVFRPDGAAPVPVIINYSPYWHNLAPPTETGGDAFSLYLIDYFVPRGYAVALVSARGTGLSEGCFTIGGPTEVADADAVATFFGTQEWSNGNVTATGKSYDGTIAQGLLTAGNEHVKTIVPVSPISELYKYNYFAGVPYLVTGQAFNTYYVAETSLAQQTDPQDESFTRTPTRFCDESAEVQLNQFVSMATGDYTPYWQARNYSALLPETLDASVFYIHGLGDWNVKPDHMVPWIHELQARDVPVKMWLGQWAHEYPTRDDFNQTLLRWLDHELKGIDTGIMTEPLVQVQDNEGVWRDEDAWPVPRASPLMLYLDANTMGLTDAPGEGSASYTDAPGVDALRFVAQPLTQPLRLVGAPTLQATLASTGPRATLTATLQLDGATIDHCMLDLAHRSSMESAEPLVPTMPVTVLVQCYPQDVLLPAGSTLSLVIAHTPGVNALVQVAPIPTSSVVTVASGDATFLTLPIIPAADVSVEDPQPVDVGCWAC